MKKGIFAVWQPLLDSIFANNVHSNICEIGTHRAKSGYQIMDYLLDNHPGTYTYHGYDLFEEANEQTDKEEFNGKGPGNFAYAKGFMQRLTARYPGRFKYELFKGYTQKTLENKIYDFVYLDGGHSYATVKHDHSKIANSKVVVFDDLQLAPIEKYFKQYVKATGLPQVEWQPDNFNKTQKPFYSVMPHHVSKVKKPVIGRPTHHIQPVIFK